MEDSFEIIIYIIFIALSLIGGLYKNYAKKKAEQKQHQSPPPVLDGEDFHDYHSETQHESEPTPRTNPFEEFIRQQLEGTAQELIPEPAQNIVEEETITENKYQTASASIEASSKEGAAAFQSTAEELISDNMNEPDFSIKDPFAQDSSPITDMISEHEITSEHKLAEDIDLKKAVIYSEIIKRPDF